MLMEGIKALEWETSRGKLSLICKAGEKKEKKKECL